MAAGGTPSRTRRSSRLRIAPRSIGPTVLPPELVTRILEYLPSASLRQAASVSHQFYDCAWAAGLYIHRWLVWGHPKRCHQQLASLDELVKHALPKNLRLSLSFWWFSSRDYDDSIPSDRYDSGYPRLDDILPVIVAALPLLVHLSIKVSHIEKVIAILCHRMPCLRHLEIMRTTYDSAYDFALPRDLLAGRAPLLRQLELANVTLSTPALPAFSNVTSLRFAYEAELPDFDFAHHFPRLSALSLKSYSVDDPDPSQSLKLTGLSLQSLAFEAEMLESIRRTVALDAIRVLRCRLDSWSISWLEPDSEHTAEFSLRLSGHLERDSQLSVIVVPAHRGWRRIYDIHEWFPGNVLPLADKRGGTARLAYLRVENVFLHAFLSCEASFPALKDIQLDFYRNNAQPAIVWPPNATDIDFNGTFAGLFLPEHRTAPTFNGTGNPYNVSCPVLEELTLFALDEGITVQSREVAFLGRALGQLARAKRDKATLAIVGVKLALPEARTLLGLAFSSVQRYAFAGRDSTEDRDDGLWDAEA